MFCCKYYVEVSETAEKKSSDLDGELSKLLLEGHTLAEPQCDSFSAPTKKPNKRHFTIFWRLGENCSILHFFNFCRILKLHKKGRA